MTISFLFEAYWIQAVSASEAISRINKKTPQVDPFLAVEASISVQKINRLMMKRVLLVLVVAAWTAVVYAQPAPIKWGEVPMKDLTMDVYPADTNAATVILADYGNIDLKSSGKLVFKRHVRIKLLSEAGYDWATVVIPYVAADKLQKVSGIKGQTVTLGSNNRPQRHKLDKKAIFEEDLDGLQKQFRFTLPALEPGAVIEYQYAIATDHPLYFPGWPFQATEPTRWSEYRIETPALFDFAFIRYGELPYHIEEREPKPYQGIVAYRWAMKDVPALREEPFMTTPADYVAALEMQLRSFIGIDLLTSWEDVAHGLLITGAFGNFMDPDSLVRVRAREVTEGVTGGREKMEAICDFVRTGMTWDGVSDFTPGRPLVETLEKRTGNSADLTMLLIAMLRAVNLKADPLLLSTRDHGRVIESYPVMSQFNYVLARLEVDEETHLLDPTDSHRPCGLLPPRALNGRGLLLKEEQTRVRNIRGSKMTKRSGQWIDILASGAYKHAAYLDVTLDSTGGLTAIVKVSDGEYSALEKRHVLAALEPEEYLRDIVLDGLTAAEVTSDSIENVSDVTEILRTRASFSLSDYAQVAGDFMYLNPSVLDRMHDNPLRLPERTFPVDMTYPRSETFTGHFTVPPGYTVEDLPEDVHFSLPSGGGAFKRAMSAQDSTFSMHSRFILTRDWFPPEQYQELQSFFERIVAAQAEQVVLKRTTEPETNTPGGTER